MKKIISTTLLAVILSLGLVGCVKNEPCDTLPEGYIIVTDGENYRWRNNVITSGFDKNSKEAAINYACRYQKSQRLDDEAASWPEAND